MFRNCILILTCILGVAFARPALCGEGSGLVTQTGNLLHGTLYKRSGIAREGLITIETSWRLPGFAPVYRYDFDVLYGTIDKNLYSYQMADIAEMEFLPIEDGGQPVNLKLRNGMMQKLVLTSNDKTLIGTARLMFKDALIVTDKYGDNIVEGGDVSRIVFSSPAETAEESLPALVDRLGKTLQVGSRDGLIDKDFLAVLENLQKRMQTRAK